MARGAGPHDAAGMLDELLDVDGYAAPGWGGVLDAFAENFACHGESGAAVCVYHDGRPVVDLAARTADPAIGRAYTRDRLQPIMSVSKGIVAIAVNMLPPGRAGRDRPAALPGRAAVVDTGHQGAGRTAAELASRHSPRVPLHDLRVPAR
jgi:hypothetical protein